MQCSALEQEAGRFLRSTDPKTPGGCRSAVISMQEAAALRFQMADAL
jgi:hypothetical protein